MKTISIALCLLFAFSSVASTDRQLDSSRDLLFDVAQEDRLIKVIADHDSETGEVLQTCAIGDLSAEDLQVLGVDQFCSEEDVAMVDRIEDQRQVASLAGGAFVATHAIACAAGASMGGGNAYRDFKLGEDRIGRDFEYWQLFAMGAGTGTMWGVVAGGVHGSYFFPLVLSHIGAAVVCGEVSNRVVHYFLREE